MQIGSFAFQAQGPEYATLERRSARRWVRRERHGRPPALDDLGRQADEITLRGMVVVRTARDLTALDALREAAGLADGADAVSLPVYIGGGAGASGTYLGQFVVQRLRTTERDLRFSSIPTRIDFQVSLLEDAAANALAGQDREVTTTTDSDGNQIRIVRVDGEVVETSIIRR